MLRDDPGPRRSGSVDTYRRRARALAALAVLALIGGIVSDELARAFWTRHSLLAGLVASVIVVMLTVALVNETIERRSRQRWRVLAQYVMLQLVRETRFVWTGLAELAGLTPPEMSATHGDVLAAASSLEASAAAVRDTARLNAALRAVVGEESWRRRLYEEVSTFVDHSDDVLGRWAGVMLNADAYAEVIDRHVELAGDLAWLAGLLSFAFSEQGEVDPLGRHHPAALIEGPLDDERFVRTLTAMTQLAEQLDRTTLALALQIVPVEWWRKRLGADAPTPLGDLEPSAAQDAPASSSATRASQPVGAPPVDTGR
jgi:hypothetical protein